MKMRLKISSLQRKLKHQPQLKSAMNVVTSTLCIGLLMFTAARLPQTHTLFLRYTVGSKVYKIQAELRGGGGTGFQVKAPSGTNYVMTNSHVCQAVEAYDAPENKGTALLVDDYGNWVRRRIVAVSDQSDLCLIEGAPGVEGLSLGSEPGLGETMTVVGHPHLKPITLSSGDITGREDVTMLDYVMSVDNNPAIAAMVKTNPDGKCNMPKNQIDIIPIPSEYGGGTVKTCSIVTAGAYSTSIVIYPGNSGSPMVDWYGNVVGVAFAADSSDNYGVVVSLDDIQNFISRY
jgi:S1-C subfamily serine protease